MFSSDGQWSFDYYDEDEEDEYDEDDVEMEDVDESTELDTKQHAKASSSSTPANETNTTDDDDAERSAAEAMARQIALDEQAAEEERAKKAAKKREKKLRKKEKQKQEAALKNKEAEQKKRSKQIQSWRSRVVAACLSNENYKIQGLLAESPLGKQPDEDVTVHLEFLLPHCIATSKRDEGDEACQKLATYVISMSVSVAFTIGRNGRSALHNACFVGDCFFVKVVTDKSQQDSPLDLLCKDSGWTPLHYAVAAACPEAMEELLIVGCDYDTCTDESLTCRARYVLNVHEAMAMETS
jgi:ankyrin repeat protein